MAVGDVAANLDALTSAKRCAVFDGVDDYVEVAHNVNQLGANLADGFTISAWILPMTDGENNVGFLMTKASATSGADGWHIRYTTNNRLLFTINNGTDRLTAIDYAPFGIWTHIVVVVAADGSCTWYQNGVLFASDAGVSAAIATITSTDAVRIGQTIGATDRTWDGSIANVQMWNRILTSTEITGVCAGTQYSKGRIINVKLATDYSDTTGNTVTNSGTRLAIREDKIAASIKAARALGGATDKFLISKTEAGQIMSAVVEET